MNPPNDPHDDELRSLLRELGDAGERRARSFGATWRAATAKPCQRARPWHFGWISTAAAAIVIMIYALVQRSPKPGQVTSETADHQPLPTDFLLVHGNPHNDETIDRLEGEIDALLEP
jgi:hypothetical protein